MHILTHNLTILLYMYVREKKKHEENLSNRKKEFRNAEKLLAYGNQLSGVKKNCIHLLRKKSLYKFANRNEKSRRKTIITNTHYKEKNTQEILLSDT